MENLKDKIFKMLRLDNLMGNLTGYVEARLELFKIEIREDVAKALSKALIYGVITVFAALFLLFFSVGLAHFINGFFAQPFVGYWIVAGIYALALVLVILFRKDLDSNFEKHFMEMTKRKNK